MDGWMAASCLNGSLGGRRLQAPQQRMRRMKFGVDEGRIFRLVDTDEFDVLNAG